MNWEAVSAIATAASGLFVLVSVVMLAWQIRELRTATYAQSYMRALELLSDEETRNARAIVYGILDQRKPLESWSRAEIVAAERVCGRYNDVGMMVRYKMVPRNFIMDSYEESLGRSWDGVTPLVEHYRKTRSNQVYNAFEFLAKQSRYRQEDDD